MMPHAALLRPLALHADGLDQFKAALAAGSATDASVTIEASRFRGRPVATSAGPLYTVEKGKAIISVVGNLVSRGGWTGARGGLTSYEGIAAQFAAALADPVVKAIVLDIDSPGGAAAGAFETSAVIRTASTRKPVTAVVNGMAASAGYALASGASRILISPSSAVGSIGVVAVHMDMSARMAQAGIKPTLIHAGARKADRSAMVPLSAAARDGLQAEVDQLYGLFVDLVARHRGMSAAAVRATEAGMFTGPAAIKAKLADAIGTLDDALADAGSTSFGFNPKATSFMSHPAHPPSADAAWVSAVLSLPEAKGLEPRAYALSQTSASIAEIREELGILQKGAVEARAVASKAGGAKQQSAASIDALWDDVIARANAERGFTSPSRAGRDSQAAAGKPVSTSDAAPKGSTQALWDEAIEAVNARAGVSGV